jgi:glycerol kinase
MDESQDVFLALDQGTHSSRAILYDARANLLAKFQESVGITHPSPVSAEQDANEILQSVQTCFRSAVDQAKKNGWTIRAAGLATQRSSVVAWNRHNGDVLSPVLSWQDRRAFQRVDQLSEHASEIRKRTGLPLTPHYGASKIRWLLDNVPAVKACPQDVLGIGPLASFLVAYLTRQSDDVVMPYCIDHTNALRTQLMNLQKLTWDNDLLALFGVSGIPLPQCVPVLHPYGNLADTGIPLTTVSGDQTAAMFGQGTFPDATALVNLGTGGFTLMPSVSGEHLDEEMLGGLSISDDTSCEYLYEGTVNGCGAAMKWAASQYGLSRADLDNLDRWMYDHSSPPVFVNCVGGVGSPWWIEQGESYWCDHDGNRIDPPLLSPENALVAVAESIVFLICENLDRIRRHQSISDLQVSGGLSKVDGICHRLANLSKCSVTRSAEIEATASGVAWMAAGRPNEWQENRHDTLFVASIDEGLTQRFDVLRSQLEKLRSNQ